LALAAVGGSVDSPPKRKKLKARKMLKNAARTHRQLHALLGALIERKTLCLNTSTTADLTNYCTRIKLFQLCFDTLNNQQKA